MSAEEPTGIPRVLRLCAGNPGPMTLSGTNTYLLGSERLLIVDPGPAEGGHMELLSQAVGGRPVERICLTHAHLDHAGCAEHAADFFAAPLAGSAATLHRLGLSGHALSDEEELTPGDLDGPLVALETPGHSADHLSFFLSRERAVFTGDLVLGSGSSAVLYPDGSVGEYLSSLQRLRVLSPRVLLPGHGSPVRQAERRLHEYYEHRLSRDRQVSEAVQGNRRTLEEVREQVYGSLDPNLIRAAEASICAHLVHLRRGVASYESETLEGLLEECRVRAEDCALADH